MPIRTKAAEKRDPPRDPRADGLRTAAGMIAAGALFAAAELLIVVSTGFFGWGRAEALLFFALRPWLLIAAAAAVSRCGWRERATFYGAGLFLAAISESLFLVGLGAENPWPEAARGLLAGGLAALVIDTAVQLARRFLGRFGTAIGAVGAMALLLLPGALRPYEAIAIGRSATKPGERRDLMLLTALPLIWGEKGPLDPGSRPAAAFPMLEREFSVRALDVLDATSLGTGSLLLLAQPRALAPSELADLDAWIRRGGRALILTDPALQWPSELPLGDIRRPPPIGLLRPLLDHWGLELEGPAKPGIVLEEIKVGGERRRLAMLAPGRFATRGGSCRIGATPYIARCRIGSGEAILIADADMLHDRLWVGGSSGTARHARTSDNPLILAEFLDALGGTHRVRAEQPVEWLSGGANRTAALLLALLPLLAAAAPAAWSAVRRR